MELQDKVALVTGGSRGIGAAIARRLAADGATVAITYVNGKQKADEVVGSIEHAGGRALAIQADSGDPRAVTAAVEQTARTFGRLDIVVNNAGLFITGPVDGPDDNAAGFARQLAVNVGGVAATVRAAAKLLGDGGRVITVGSVAASRAPFPGIGDYAATKAAVAAYTRGWARDLGPKGVTVNTVQPGPIDTDMNPADGAFAGVLKGGTALGRFGKPEEVAAAVAFLAGPGASYITGATLDVDGGFNA